MLDHTKTVKIVSIGGYSRLLKYRNQIFPTLEIFQRFIGRLVFSISAIKNGGLRLTFPAKNFFKPKKARFRNSWMNGGPHQKSGPVTFLMLSMPNFLQKIWEIVRVEVSKFFDGTAPDKKTYILGFGLNWSWEQLPGARALFRERNMVLTCGFRGKLDKALNFHFQS